MDIVIWTRARWAGLSPLLILLKGIKGFIIVTLVLQLNPNPRAILGRLPSSHTSRSPPVPRAVAAAAYLAGICSGQLFEDNPSTPISSGLLVQTEEGVSFPFVDLIDESTAAGILVIPVGARRNSPARIEKAQDLGSRPRRRRAWRSPSLHACARAIAARLPFFGDRCCAHDCVNGGRCMTVEWRNCCAMAGRCFARWRAGCARRLVDGAVPRTAACKMLRVAWPLRTAGRALVCAAAAQRVAGGPRRAAAVRRVPRLRCNG
ncbi:hypothetical protein F511_17958 [Dorcoceras hygrometricum]|uniref:Uncharacterized protein n=1 Tax=Dorcoceras hygrometricum TaxID=472368 RepID=A0A2Z7CDF5_9LAMI|nr:hypothetical protein F511_17958 [Dorcoceras hygrometricum]